MVQASDVPSVALSSGARIPTVGLGTWKSETGKVQAAVEAAITAGYRHLDCAWMYFNEKEVGDGIKNKIADGTIKREDLFVTTKVWNTFHTKDLVSVGLKQSLQNLGLDYVDLTLIHWPMAFQEGGEALPKDADGKLIFSETTIEETWAGMETLVEQGLSKSIGVSNFNSKQLQRVLDVAKVKPVVNQVECHPWMTQEKLVNFCTSKGVLVEAYSPLGSPDRPWATKDDPVLMDDAILKGIAEKYNKSVAQICIKFQVQRNVIVLPKSVTPSRIAANLDVFDFTISDEDMAKIFSLNRGEEGRSCHLRWNSHHPEFPFSIEF